jgi:hypothetical protein
MGLNKPKLKFVGKDALTAFLRTGKKSHAYSQQFIAGANWQHSQTAKLVDELWEIIVMQNDALETIGGGHALSDTAYANKTLAAVEARIKLMGEKV